MKKAKKLIYAANFNENGEVLRNMLARIIAEAPIYNYLKNSYLPRL